MKGVIFGLYIFFNFNFPSTEKCVYFSFLNTVTVPCLNKNVKLLFRNESNPVP